MLNIEAQKQTVDFSAVLKAMIKCAGNQDARTNLCGIYIAKGSKVAVATDGHVLAAVSTFAFENAAGDNICEALEVAAFRAGLKVIEYTNGFFLVNAKNYDDVIKTYGAGLANIDVKDFEYPCWPNVIPEWEALQKPSGKVTYNPKLMCIANKVIDAYAGKNYSLEPFEDKMLEFKSKNSERIGGAVAAYQNILLMVMSKAISEEAEEVTHDRSDYECYKNIKHLYKTAQSEEA